MNRHNTTSLSDYCILSCNLDQLNFKDRCIINTLNQYSFIVAEKDSQFKVALTHSDILLPDGIGITLAIKFLNRQSIRKIAGYDIHEHLLSRINETGGTCFYLGSTENTLGLLTARIRHNFPNIKIKSHSPPFHERFDEHQNERIIAKINEFNPDILFVGMSAPKQEKWVHENRMKLNANIICCIGAVFDYYAMTVPRASKFWQNLGLEWFIRLLREPRRLYKRYMFYGPLFILAILKIKMFQILTSILLYYKIYPD